MTNNADRGAGVAINILLTRPQPQSERFAAQLRAAGVTLPITYAPLLKIAAVPFDPSELTDCAGVIFTSENGVNGYIAGNGRTDLPAFCVGPVTLAAAREAGFAPVHEADGDAVALSHLLTTQRPDTPLCHARGSHVAANLATSLSAAGMPTREIIVYAQHATALTQDARALLSSETDIIVPIFSPRTARLLQQEWAALNAPRARVTALAISPAAAAPLQAQDFQQIKVANAPNGAAILALLLQSLAAH